MYVCITDHIKQIEYQQRPMALVKCELGIYSNKKCTSSHYDINFTLKQFDNSERIINPIIKVVSGKKNESVKYNIQTKQ